MVRTLRLLVPVVLLAAATVIPTASLAAAPAAPAGPAITSDIRVTIGDCLVQGQTQAGTTLRITHRTSGGTVKGKAQVTANLDGDWARTCPGPKVAIGDRIELRLVGDPAIIKQLTIPVFTVITDRVNDRIRGIARGVTEVGVGLGICDPAHRECAKAGSAVLSVDPETHAFSWALPQAVNGLGTIRLMWDNGVDGVFLVQDFAHVEVQIGSARVQVTGRKPGVIESLSLRRTTPVATVSRRTGAQATFSATLKRDGKPLKVRAGDKITSTIASDASFTVPQMTVQASSSGATGTCFKNRPYSIVYLGADGSDQGATAGTTDSQGHWTTADPISAGWSVNVYCANVAGDIVRTSVVVN